MTAMLGSPVHGGSPTAPSPTVVVAPPLPAHFLGEPGDTILFLSPQASPSAPSRAARSQQRLQPFTARHATNHIPPGNTKQGAVAAPQAPHFWSPVPHGRWLVLLAQPGFPAHVTSHRASVTGGSWHSLPASSLERVQLLLFSALKSHQTL